MGRLVKLCVSLPNPADILEILPDSGAASLMLVMSHSVTLSQWLGIMSVTVSRCQVLISVPFISCFVLCFTVCADHMTSSAEGTAVRCKEQTSACCY